MPTRRRKTLDQEIDEDDFPGAEDPASFVNFLSTLASQAAAALGALPHPVTGQRSVDLETGKYWIDVLAMLREKTKGNLHPQEKTIIRRTFGRSANAICRPNTSNRRTIVKTSRSEVFGERYSWEEIV